MRADPSLPTYVLGLELTAWARFCSRRPAIVGRLAKLEWPMHFFISTMDGHNKALKSKLRALPGSELS